MRDAACPLSTKGGGGQRALHRQPPRGEGSARATHRRGAAPRDARAAPDRPGVGALWVPRQPSLTARGPRQGDFAPLLEHSTDAFRRTMEVAASPASDRSALRNAAPAVFKAREHPPPGRISRRPLSATCGPATCGPATCGPAMCGSAMCGSAMCGSAMCGSAMCGSAMCGSATLQQYGCPQAHLRTGPTCGAPARQVNVVGAFIVLKAMGRHMRDNGGGAVVNTASMAAARGTPAMCAYVASKSALVGSVQPPPPETV